MKRIQPYYYIVFIAGLFIVSGMLLFSMQLLPAAESTGVTVDPQTGEQSDNLYDFWFSRVDIYDLSIDHGLNNILFSADNNMASLFDRNRRLTWDKVFATAPQQAKLSSCGNYIAIGTAGGRLYFTSTDQAIEWDDEGNPVDLIVLSPNANWIAVARSQPGQDLNTLELYNQKGDLQWSIKTGPIKNLYLTSEYLEQVNIYYTSRENDEPVVTAVNLDGKKLWSYEGEQLAAVSKHGSRLAAIEEKKVTVYDSLGYAMWSTGLPFEAEKVFFNPQNYNRLLIYGSSEGSGDNLYYYDLAEDLLWMKRIADNSLLSFTADGHHIVTSSWRHYKEDYTQMILLDRDGAELNSWEVAMRVEHLALSGHPYLALVGGEDGYIDLVDLQPLLRKESDVSANNGNQEAKIYNPVTTGIRADETRLMLYFIDESNNMVPVTRSVSSTEDALNAALKELIRGPARDSSLYRTIPDKNISAEAELHKEDDFLAIDLSREFAELNGSAQARIALNSLVMTVSHYTEASQIYLAIDGEAVSSFGEELELTQPLERFQWNSPVYLPVQSGERYYLVIEEGAEEGDSPDLQRLVTKTVHACRSLPFVPANLDLLELHASSDQVQISLSSSLRAIFPDDPTEREQLHAALVLDALFMTIFNNSRSQRVEILLDGQPLATSEEYPATSRFFRQPNFINPEQ